jgi:hypothetical protein
MRTIGAIAVPPKGTQARELFEQYLGKVDTPERKREIHKLWKIAHAIVTGQQLNGAGYVTDQTLRWFHGEYNNRIWSYGLHSLPSTFNVAEAFLQYDPRINAVILHEETNHLFSLIDFVDWYTAGDVYFDYKDALDAFTPGVIYGSSKISVL